MAETKRQICQCLNAKVKTDRVVCVKGHMIGKSMDGSMSLTPIMRGVPCEITTCQNCSDYDEMGPPLEKGERGWIQRNYRRD